MEPISHAARDQLLGLAAAITIDPSAAEGIVQEALARGPGRVAPSDSSYAHVRAVVVELAVSHTRARRGSAIVGGAAEPVVTSTPEIGAAWAEVQRLPAAQRAAVLLQHWDALGADVLDERLAVEVTGADDALLREMCDDVVPQLIARARMAPEVVLVEIGDGSAPEPSGARRRWSVAAMLVVLALIAGVVLIRELDDGLSSTPPVVTTDPALPEWFPLLRAAVPARFEYLALTASTATTASFVAIEPDDGKVLDLFVDATTGSKTVDVRCDVGEASGSGDECAEPVPDSSQPFTTADLAAVGGAIDITSLVAAAQRPVRLRLVGPSVPAQLAHTWPMWQLQGTSGADTDLEFVYGQGDIGPSLGSVRVIGDVYPRPTEPMDGRLEIYDDPPSAVLWVVEPSGVAVRIRSSEVDADAVTEMRSVAGEIAFAVSVAAQDTVPVVGPNDPAEPATPSWYDLLRPAIPARFRHLAVVSASTDVAEFIAIADDGSVLRLGFGTPSAATVATVSTAMSSVFSCGVPGDGDLSSPTQVPEVECDPSALAGMGEGPGISVARLLAAAAEPRDDDAYVAAGLAVAPVQSPSGWQLSAQSGSDGAAQLYVFGRATDTIDVWVRVVGGVWPRPSVQEQTPDVHHGSVTSWWVIDPSGFAAQVVVRDGANLETGRILGSYQLQSAAIPAEQSSVTFLRDHNAEVAITVGAEEGDDTVFTLERAASALCVLDGPSQSSDACFDLLGVEWPTTAWTVPWGNKNLVFGLLDGPFHVALVGGVGADLDISAGVVEVDGRWVYAALIEPGEYGGVFVVDADGNELGTSGFGAVVGG